MNFKNSDVAGLLSIAGAVLMVLSAMVEQQQRRQENKEIAREVVKLLREG